MLDFTPKQLHYFKRELITKELEKEIRYLLETHSETLSNLVADGSSEDEPNRLEKDEIKASDDVSDKLPFLKYIFDNIIIEFPLLKHTCDDQFWPKCKLLLNEFNKLQLESFYTPKRSESNRQRRSIQHKIQKSLVFAFCASIKTVQGAEESIRINADTMKLNGSKSSTTADGDSEQDARKQQVMPDTPEATAPTTPTQSKAQPFKTNILTVREVKQKKTLRDATHAVFLIETYFPEQPHEPVYVARRHGDFRRLREQLKQYLNKHHPHHHHNHLPLVPPKSDDVKINKASTATRETIYRESDRLALRNFLFKLTGTGSDGGRQHHVTQQQQHIRKSPILRNFLSKNPIVFTVEEEQDALRREEKDKRKREEQDRYQKELDHRVHELNQTLDSLKKEILKPGGLIKVFETIKMTATIQELPYSLYKALEWGRINFAFALHRQFVSSDAASENLTNLRRTHTLMPYKTVSLILRFSNPMTMVKGILDLFLAQPFGGRSLFQRMIISNLNEESKAFEKEIKQLEAKINNNLLCEKLHNAVRTAIPETNASFRDIPDRVTEVLSVLNNDGIEPCIPKEQLSALNAIAINRYSSEEAEVKRLKQVSQLWELYARQHEHELLMTLVFQGVTGELLKEFISVFYQPLAQVYKAADISTTIRHVAAFIDDLIKTVDALKRQQQQQQQQSDITATTDSITSTIQIFIDLVQRHEQHFYEFVHNVHTQEASNVFDELIQYLDKLFTFVANGIPGLLDLNSCIEQAGITPTNSQAQEELKDEINAICNYRYQQKMYHFEHQRRKLNHATTTPEGLQTIAETVNRQRQNEVFQFIPKSSEMMNALDDLEEFHFDDEVLDGDEGQSSRRSSDASHGSSSSGGDFDLLNSDDESASSSSSSSNGSMNSSGAASTGSSSLSHKGIDKPALHWIPKIIPYFVREVSQLMNYTV